MVKTYLKYVLKDSYGVISTTNAVFDAGERAAVTGALECPTAWDFKRSERTWTARDPEDAKTEITVVSVLYPEGRTVATGHSDGTVRLWTRASRGPNANTNNKKKRIPDRSSSDWDLMDEMELEEAEDALADEAPVTLSGHRSAVTTLVFGNGGSMLASGARDTDIVVWDVTGERGLFRLRGHTGPITALCWLEKAHAIVSCSKDTLVKVWSVDNQQCLQTIVGHRSEVLCAAVAPAPTEHATLFTGAADGKIRVWNINNNNNNNSTTKAATEGNGNGNSDDSDEKEDNEDNEDNEDVVKLEGVLVPPASAAGSEGSNGKITSMCVSNEQRLLSCVVGDKVAVFYKILSDAEVEKKKRRREQRSKSKKRQRLQQQQQQKMKDGDNDHEEEEEEEEEDDGKESDRIEVEDRYSYLWPMRASGKIRSIAFNKKADRALVALNNNALEVYDLYVDPQKSEETAAEEEKEKEEKEGAEESGSGKTHYALAHSVSQQGHRTDIRALALTTDSGTIVSVSNGSTKIWGMNSSLCRRTVECGYGLCAAVVPGNRHVVVGTKEGTLQVVEINSGVILEEVEAHKGAVWSVCTRPDGSGIVTGSADHTVKFWDFDLRKPAAGGGGGKGAGSVLSLVETTSATLEDDVLCVKMSPDGKLLAVALLDNSIKVYKCTSGELKFFLSLYGHKLPVLTIDISSDSRLLASGSADKNVKIWGLDFGDCHRSLFAHNDSVTQVAFVQNTHYLFSVGKDGRLKYWDADKFEQIQALDAQRGTGSPCWAVAVGARGALVVTAGHDRSIRIWERTQEQLFLEEEREKALDAQFEATIDENEAFADRNDPSRPEAEEATRKSLATVRSGEVLLEALELAEEEEAKAVIHRSEVAAAEAAGEEPPAAPQPNVRMLGLSENDFVLKRLAEIPASHIEQALLILPFHHAAAFLRFANTLIEQGKCVELCAQCVFFLLRVHHAQITASQDLRPVVDSLLRNTRTHVKTQRDVVGFNLAAMNYMKHELELEGEFQLFDDVEDKIANLRISGSSRKGKGKGKDNSKGLTII